jgi:hypothetical protein
MYYGTHACTFLINVYLFKTGFFAKRLTVAEYYIHLNGLIVQPILRFIRALLLCIKRYVAHRVHRTCAHNISVISFARAVPTVF